MGDCVAAGSLGGDGGRVFNEKSVGSGSLLSWRRWYSEPHEIGEARNEVLPGHPVFEKAPETYAQLSAGLLQARKGVTAAASQIAAGRSADLALCHVFTDICLTRIVVQGHVRSVEYQQKFRLVLVDPL